MKSRLIKSSVLLIFIATVAKLLGFAREIIFAKYLGTSAVSDAYVLGITISQIVLTGIGESFFKVYLPIATEEKIKSAKKYIKYTGNLLIIGTLLFLLICIIISLTSKYTINLLAKDASQEVIEMAILVCKLTAIPSVFIFVLNVCQGYLHIQEKFWTNMIYPLLMNLTIILFIINTEGNIYGLTNAYNFSIIIPATVLLLLCYTYKLRFVLPNRKNIEIKNFKKTIVLVTPLFMGGMVSQINEIIDRSFSAHYSVGILSALRYGKLLEIFVVSVIAIPIGQAVFPRLSAMAQEKKFEDMSKLVSLILTILVIISLPIMFGIIVLGDELVELLFMRGAFNLESAKNTSIAFICYGFSILPVSFSEILNRCFISLENTKKPIQFSIIAMGTNIILNFFSVYIFGFDFYFLAITTTIAETIMGILYYVNINKSKLLLIRVYIKVIVSSLISSLVMFYALSLLERYIVSGNVLYRLLIEFTSGVFIYGLIMFIVNRKFIITLLNSKKRNRL